MNKSVTIIGGGASGLIASIYIAKRGYDVTILERNSSCGKKILITGNGRCNYFNSNQDLKHYHSSSMNNLCEIINIDNQNEILSFFNKIGIVPKIKNGYYYPYSNQAVSIKTNLLKEAELSGVVIKNDYLVEKIEKNNQQFIITTSKGLIKTDAVIIATGSNACPKTGSDGMGYSFAKSFGHTIVPILPSLVPLKANEKFLKDWDGIRTDVKMSLCVDDIKVKEETGEIQLTDYGISGICSFNLSSLANINLNNNRKVYVKINFIPWINKKEDFINFLNNQDNIDKRDIISLLEGVLNYKLLNVLLSKIGIKNNELFINLTDSDINQIYEELSEFKLDIVGSQDYDRAQVCSGGVSLEEINIDTMQSKLVDGLYFVGEILDVDGDCGGYNLSFAWISGMIAGRGVFKDDTGKAN